MSIRNNAIKGVITVSTLLNVSMGLIGALSLLVYNNMSTRTDKVEARVNAVEDTQVTQQTEILNVANNVYLLCKASKNTECIAPDKPVK